MRGVTTVTSAHPLITLQLRFSPDLVPSRLDFVKIFWLRAFSPIKFRIHDSPVEDVPFDCLNSGFLISVRYRNEFQFVPNATSNCSNNSVSALLLSTNRDRARFCMRVSVISALQLNVNQCRYRDTVTALHPRTRRRENNLPTIRHLDRVRNVVTKLERLKLLRKNCLFNCSLLRYLSTLFPSNLADYAHLRGRAS